MSHATNPPGRYALLAILCLCAVLSMSTWFREQRGIAMGAVIGAIALGSALPHLVNAGLNMHWHAVIATTSAATLGWQYAFLILVPGPVVGVLAMLALRRCPESVKFAGRRR